MEVFLEVLASKAHHEVGVQAGRLTGGRRNYKATGGDALR